MSDGFTMELCGNQNAWRIEPTFENHVFDLEQTGLRIEEAGFTVEVRSRLCWTFTGKCDMTLYPSGSLLIKSEDKELAQEIATMHLEQWAK